MTTLRPNALRLNPADSVVIAMRRLEAGELVEVEIGSMQAAEVRHLHPPQRHPDQSLMGMTT